MVTDNKKNFKKDDKELEKQIFSLFDLDEYDEIILNKEMLKQKLPLLDIIYHTHILKTMVDFENII